MKGGEVSEWFKVPLSKSGRLKGLAGSNPALSAGQAISRQLLAFSSSGPSTLPYARTPSGMLTTDS